MRLRWVCFCAFRSVPSPRFFGEEVGPRACRSSPCGKRAVRVVVLRECHRLLAVTSHSENCLIFLDYLASFRHFTEGSERFSGFVFALPQARVVPFEVHRAAPRPLLDDVLQWLCFVISESEAAYIQPSPVPTAWSATPHTTGYPSDANPPISLLTACWQT